MIDSNLSGVLLAGILGGSTSNSVCEDLLSGNG